MCHTVQPSGNEALLSSREFVKGVSAHKIAHFSSGVYSITDSALCGKYLVLRPTLGFL